MIDDRVYLDRWFETTGAYVLVDGQFGSTGKGLMAAWLAIYGKDKISHITTNAGPNSGHTAYFYRPLVSASDLALVGEMPAEGPIVDEHEKVMTQQVPVASVFMEKLGRSPVTLLNAGAVIDDKILADEVKRFNLPNLLIHPNAVVINDDDRNLDKVTLSAIAGTGKGVGPAQARKVMRTGDGLAQATYRPMLPVGFRSDRGWDNFWDWDQDVAFVETAQGFSLGINQARFYPNVTSRECTVMQALSDARIPAQMLRGVVACFRTYPIRVGDTENSSGGCYEDQIETTWEAIGQKPELTTVTKRVRRVFSWSRIQFKECIAANRPDVVFINFMNYLTTNGGDQLVNTILHDYRDVMGGGSTPIVLGGYSEHTYDIRRLA